MRLRERQKARKTHRVTYWDSRTINELSGSATTWYGKHTKYCVLSAKTFQ